MRAVILAAGEGTRLRPLTFMRQKPMTPVGNEPSIFYLLSHLAREGFDDIVVIVGGPLKQHLMDYVGDGSRFGVKITYAVKPDEFNCGTAGSLKLVDGLFDDAFLVAQADTLTEIPLGEAVRSHLEKGAMATIVLTRVKNPSDFGVAVLDGDGAITEFQEKPAPKEAKSDLVSTGFYVLEPECLEHLGDEKWDFARDLFPHLLKIHKKVDGFVSDAFWVDIGRLDGYLRGVAWALQTMPRETPQNFVVADTSSLVIIEKGAQVGARARVTGPALIEAGAVIEDGASIEEWCLVKKDARVLSGAVIRRSAIMERAEVGRQSRVMNSVIGQSAVVGQNVLMNRSIVGPGSIVGDGAKLLVDSRTWPNVQIKAAEIVAGTVTAPVEKAFYFCSSFGQYTGVMASSTNGLLEALGKAPVESIEFHARRRELERWVRDVLESDDFADALALPCKNVSLTGEDLRDSIIHVVGRRVADISGQELAEILPPDGDEPPGGGLEVRQRPPSPGPRPHRETRGLDSTRQA